MATWVRLALVVATFLLACSSWTAAAADSDPQQHQKQKQQRLGLSLGAHGTDGAAASWAQHAGGRRALNSAKVASPPSPPKPPSPPMSEKKTRKRKDVEIAVGWPGLVGLKTPLKKKPKKPPEKVGGGW
jgi:hypothetical protein